MRLTLERDEYQLTDRLFGYFKAEVVFGFINQSYYQDVRVLSWGFFGDNGCPEPLDEHDVATRITEPVEEAIQYWKDTTPEWEAELLLMDPCHPRNQES